MGFTTTERINLFTKALAAGVIDANSVAVWYETFFPFNFILDSALVWTDLSTVRANPAANLAAAQANAAGPLAGIVDDLSAPVDAIRLTNKAGANNSTFVAYSTYGDTSSPILNNWLLPQLVPQASGTPSIGYAIRLYNGDPNGGGTEVTASAGTTGTGVNKTVGWIYNYANGLLFVSDDFYTETGITEGTFDPYILGFRYIGATAESPAGGSDPTAIHDNIAGEIAAITEKSSPVPGDLIVIEDSEDANNKKRVELGNLPGTPEVIESKSANYSIVTNDAGKTFTNQGSSGTIVLALPEASAGLAYSFVARSSNVIQVTASSGNIIQAGSGRSGAGGIIESTGQGDTLKLVAINSTEWYAVPGIVGTWVVT